MVKANLIVPILLSMAAAVGLYAGQGAKPRMSSRFVGLGDLPGGIALSVANGISADGKVVVGYSHSEKGTEAFRWTIDDGMEGLGFPLAFATSANGSVVVGHRLSGGRSQPVCWTEHDGVVAPNDFRDYRRGAAQGISADGRTVVGVVGTGLSETEGHDWAFRWAPSGPFHCFVSDRDQPDSTDARSVSADGKVVVGMRRHASGHAEAFRWTAERDSVGLGCLPGHSTSCAYAVSLDGSVVVGCSSDFTTTEAFRWTEETGMVRLVAIDEASSDSMAYAVSADGAVIVGGNMSHRGQEAFIWDAEHGMRRVRDLLAVEFAKGGSLDGWRLSMATAVSADGSIVAGVGMNPVGEREAWVARLSPAAANESIGEEPTFACAAWVNP